MCVMIITKEEFYDSNLWRLFPVLEIPCFKDIPSDYLGAMGVPISTLSKLDYRDEDSQFELLDYIRPSVNGVKKYIRLLVRLRRPPLPDSFSLDYLQDLLDKSGSKYEITGFELFFAPKVKP